MFMWADTASSTTRDHFGSARAGKKSGGITFAPRTWTGTPLTTQRMACPKASSPRSHSRVRTPNRQAAERPAESAISKLYRGCLPIPAGHQSSGWGISNRWARASRESH